MHASLSLLGRWGRFGDKYTGSEPPGRENIWKMSVTENASVLWEACKGENSQRIPSRQPIMLMPSPVIPDHLDCGFRLGKTPSVRLPALLVRICPPSQRSSDHKRSIHDDSQVPYPPRHDGLAERVAGRHNGRLLGEAGQHGGLPGFDVLGVKA